MTLVIWRFLCCPSTWNKILIKKSSYNVKKDFKYIKCGIVQVFRRTNVLHRHRIVLLLEYHEVQHICATCYRLDKIRNFHPECSSACPHYNEWLYVHDQLISESSLWSAKHSLKCQFCIDNQWEKKVLLGFILLHNHIRNSGVYNSQGCRIPIHSNLNIEFWRISWLSWLSDFWLFRVWLASGSYRNALWVLLLS